MSSTDDRALRSDARINHISAAEQTRRASGPIRRTRYEDGVPVSTEVIPAGGNTKKQAMPETPENELKSLTHDQVEDLALEMVSREIQQIAARARLKNGLDDGDLQRLDKVSAVLVRLRRASAKQVDVTKLTDDELTAAAK